jgi:predicted N-acyltransferase
LNFGQEEARVFLYYHRDQLVAFNYCLLTRGFLVDKYIGFDYTVSRDLNLYFVSWFHNLEYCLQHSLTVFVAGWSDPEIKARLGAKFTFTHHAVYFKNPLLRWLLRRFKGVFEADKNAVYGD